MLPTGTRGAFLDIEDVIAWIQRDAAAAQSVPRLLQGLTERLDAIGLPVDRVWQAYFVLHPQVGGRDWTWYRGGEVEFSEFVRDQPDAPRAPSDTPLGRVLDGEVAVRARLAEATDARSVALRAQGYTDYWIGSGPALFPPSRAWLSPIVQNARSGSITAWATRQDGGWSDDQLAMLERVHLAFTLACEVAHQRLIARGLLTAYLGRDAGDRVLNGQISRGDVRTVEAAILFTDLRSFTRMSETLDPEAFIDWLGAAFDAQIGAIHAAGGDVLQIVGDALLAIFEDEDPRAACTAALSAIRGIEAAIDATNAVRTEAGAAPVEWGAALHYGAVHHGNFGARDRIAFTVNGPAVNRAARLESIGAQLGLCPALSDAFAAHCGRPVRDRGTHPAKGLHERLRVWELA